VIDDMHELGPPRQLELLVQQSGRSAVSAAHGPLGAGGAADTRQAGPLGQTVALAADSMRLAVIAGWLIMATWDAPGTSTTSRALARL
jgi:hypothetical protein